MVTPALPAAGTVLAFDFGERRVGVAVGDLSLRIAHPLTTIEAKSDRERLDAVKELVQQWHPVIFVVGLPTHMDGAEHELTARCRKFAQRLRMRFDLPAELIDERLTSYCAELELAQAGRRGRAHKALIDQVAAQHILDSFFEMHPHAA